MKYSLLYIAFVSFLNLFFLTACSTDEKKADTPEGLFAIAQEYEKDERYEEAIKRYSEIKNRFPYSSMATKAELAIADVHFKEESFAEAQLSYAAFRELHPKHPQIDYVIFRTGLSFYNQLPETTDRDMTLANDAINSFNEIITNYSSSPHANEAKEKRNEALKKLAEKEDYIGDFYFKRGFHESALPRYENLLKKYSGLGFDSRALGRLVISAKKINDPAKAKKYFEILKEKYSDTSDYNEARKVMN